MARIAKTIAFNMICVVILALACQCLLGRTVPAAASLCNSTVHEDGDVLIYKVSHCPLSYAMPTKMVANRSPIYCTRRKFLATVFSELNHQINSSLMLLCIWPWLFTPDSVSPAVVWIQKMFDYSLMPQSTSSSSSFTNTAIILHMALAFVRTKNVDWYRQLLKNSRATCINGTLERKPVKLRPILWSHHVLLVYTIHVDSIILRRNRMLSRIDIRRKNIIIVLLLGLYKITPWIRTKITPRNLWFMLAGIPTSKPPIYTQSQ